MIAIKKVGFIFIILCLPLFVLLQIFQWISLDLNYFEKKFIENHTDQITGLSHEQLIRVSNEIILYLIDERDDLIIYEEVNGVTIQVFEGREIKHMVDVKDLFTGGFLIKRITGFLSVLSILVLAYLDKKLLMKGIRMGSMLYFFAIVVIGIYGVLDFNQAFIIFHEILFTNDLWLLNPETDIMIQMLPLNFFMGIAMRIGVYYFVYLIVSILMTTYLLKKCFVFRKNLV